MKIQVFFIFKASYFQKENRFSSKLEKPRRGYFGTKAVYKFQFSPASGFEAAKRETNTPFLFGKLSFFE